MALANLCSYRQIVDKVIPCLNSTDVMACVQECLESDNWEVIQFVWSISSLIMAFHVHLLQSDCPRQLRHLVGSNSSFRWMVQTSIPSPEARHCAFEAPKRWTLCMYSRRYFDKFQSFCTEFKLMCNLFNSLKQNEFSQGTVQELDDLLVVFQHDTQEPIMLGEAACRIEWINFHVTSGAQHIHAPVMPQRPLHSLQTRTCVNNKPPRCKSLRNSSQCFIEVVPGIGHEEKTRYFLDLYGSEPPWSVLEVEIMLDTSEKKFTPCVKDFIQSEWNKSLVAQFPLLFDSRGGRIQMEVQPLELMNRGRMIEIRVYAFSYHYWHHLCSLQSELAAEAEFVLNQTRD